MYHHAPEGYVCPFCSFLQGHNDRFTHHNDVVLQDALVTAFIAPPHGELLLGLMWHSTKALDLLRDPRCTLHTAITSLEGTEGECKLDGRAAEATDPVVQIEHQAIFGQHWADQTPQRFHVFALDVEHAAFIIYESAKREMRVVRWDLQQGLRESQKPYP